MLHIAHFRAITAARNGNVAILMGFLLIPLLGMVGLSVDAIRMFRTHADLNYALDTAMHAGLRARTAQEAEHRMRGFFETNWLAAKHPVVNDGTLGVSIGHDEETGLLTGKAHYEMPTIFLRMAGVPSIRIATSITIEPTQKRR